MERTQERGSGSDINSSIGSSSTCPERGTDPVFPTELEREIFEIAALSFPRCAPTLVLVAKRVQQWIEPQIYEVLAFQSNGNYRPPLYETNESGRSKKSNFERATAYAKHVLLEGIEASIVIEVLQSCIHITNLVLWGSDMDMVESLNRLIRTLPVERLSANVLTLDGWSLTDVDGENGRFFKFDHTSFVNLTHLDVTYMPKFALVWSKWINLTLLPRLTHLAFSASTPEMVEGVLGECKNIQLLVLIYQEDWGLLDAAGSLTKERLDEIVLNDTRVVQILDRYSDDWIADWISGAEGKEDFWITAEKIQATKHEKLDG